MWGDCHHQPATVGASARLNRIKQSVKKTVCKTNLRNIGLAIHLYLADNQGRFYQSVNANVKFGGWEGMIFLDEQRPINPYLSIPEIPRTEAEAHVFKCLSDRGGLMGKSIPLYSYVGTSYQANHFLIGPDQVGTMPSLALSEGLNRMLKNLKSSDIDSPDRLVLAGDYGWLNQYRPGVPVIGQWHVRQAFHNIVFLDGHADYIEFMKGLYVTPDYTVLPFNELSSLAIQVQKEEN